jgi:precorrin-2 dehydrogenase / sirohydrochlorin ferrochelatase
MGYLPIFLDLGGRPCLVIGGGEVAEMRVGALLEAGAIVTVVGREATDRIRVLAEAAKLRHLARDYEYGDLHGYSLVYVATTNGEVARRAASEARETGIPINVVDSLESSTFITPATFKRGDLQIAISTAGASPAIARKIRQRLEQQIGPEYGVVLEIMRRARDFLRNREPDQAARACIFRLLADALLDCVQRLDYPRIDEVLRLHLDAGMAELGLDMHSSAWTGKSDCD